MVFDPMHFLPLLEQKTGALDQAAPLQGWNLPGEFATLRRLLEARMGKKGKREYVQILRLLETFEMGVVHGAVRQALDLGAIGYDAVKHLILCRIEQRPPRLDLDIYPYLPRAQVETTKPTSYMSLMSGTAVSATRRRCCCNTTSRSCACPLSCPNTPNWHSSALPETRPMWTISCASANWS